MQEYEYKGSLEGMGRIDKFWTAIIDKQTYLKLIHENKMDLIHQYLIPVHNSNLLGQSKQNLSINTDFKVIQELIKNKKNQ